MSSLPKFPSLCDTSFEVFCNHMDEKILQTILEYYPASMIFDVLWKVRNFIE